MNWDNQVALDLLPELGMAFWVILQATVGASVICLVLGLLCAIALRSGPAIVRIPLFAVLEFIRNTPLLVQLFFAYLICLSLIEMTQTSRLILGMVVLGIHYTTYTSEVYRAGIDGVAKGQWEAITALSLPKRYAWQHVILPQAFRRVVPALGNYIISMFKEVPALTVIGVAEMVSAVKAYQVENLTGYVEGFTIAGLIFLAASYPVAVAMRKLEKRLGN